MTRLPESIMRFCKTVAAVWLIAAFSLSGTKAFGDSFVDLGTFTAPTSISIANTHSGNGTIFSDVFSFSVSADSSLATLLAAVSFKDIVGITGFTSSLWLAGGATPLASGVTTSYGTDVLFTTSTITYAPLLAGPPPVYEIHAGGTILGPSGSYGGAMVLSPVPEPEIYAMLAVGLGFMGFVTRRRKQQR